jgi:murein L,D-transpeptidase YcbB/YkuD
MSVGRRTSIVVCAIALGLPASAGAQVPGAGDPVRATIAGWVAQERPPAALTGLAKPNAFQWSLTRRFYAQRDFAAAWRSDGTGAEVGSLVGRLGRAAEQGLDSADYPVAQIRALAASPSDPDSLALLDLAATVAFFRYAADLSLGRVVPAAIDTMWAAADRPLDLAARLAEALDLGRVDAALGELAPPQREAALLRAALARYRAIAALGGWTAVPGMEPLSLGATGPRVGLLRRRLEITGDLAPGDGWGAEIFDSALDAGVRLAQARHGLTADGVAGPATLAALNVPVTARIRQLELNLERWRWAPRDEGERYLSVNSADYSLEVVDSERSVLTSRIVAGRADWPTPIVAGVLTEVTFNPRWSIPRSITVKEILPILQRDPDYLLREGIHVTDTTEEATELDPALIAWDSVTAGSFPYRLWQEPGPRNPLGRIRFGIRNRFGVALHDTPYPQTFGVSTRAFSHGCVRVEAAESLAVYVLRGLPGWSADSVCAILGQESERYLAVADPIPVLIGYWTAWMGSDGEVQFRPDVYRWDAELDTALRRRTRSGRR